jgi:hypothetical protein
MKTFQNIANRLTRGAVLGVVTAWALLSGSLTAQEKGAERLLKLQRVTAVADVQKVEPGDTMAMPCPKCKDTWVTVAEKTGKAVNPQEKRRVLRHECPGCQTRIVTDELARPPKDKVVHTCRNCGITDAYCCAPQKGAGATPGMEDHLGHQR